MLNLAFSTKNFFEKRGNMKISKVFLFMVMIQAVSGPAKAEESTFELDKNATYTKDLKRGSPFPAQIERVLTNRAMTALNGRDGRHLAGALDLMSRIFISHRFSKGDKKIVLAMSGIKMPESVRYNVIYSVPTGYILHFKNGEGGVALYFKGFPQDVMSEIQMELARETRSRISFLSPGRSLDLVSELLLPSAFAEDDQTTLCGGTDQEGSPTGSSTASYLKNISECTKGALWGVWDGSFGGAWTLVKGVGTAVIHPIETFDRAAQTVYAIADALSDLAGTYGEFSSKLRSLPSDVKWHLGCELVSTIGTSGLIAYLTLGAGSPVLIEKTAQALAKISSALPLGSPGRAQVLSLSAKLNARVASTKDLHSLIAQGPNGKELVDKINEFDKVINQRRETWLMYRYRNDYPAYDDGGAYMPYHVTENLNNALEASEAFIASNPVLFEIAHEYLPSMPKLGIGGWEWILREGKWRVLTDDRAKQEIVKEIEKELVARQNLTAGQRLAIKTYLSTLPCQAAGRIKEQMSANNSSFSAR